MGFFAELKRRNVIRVAGLYGVGAWLIVQVASTVLPIFAAPAWLPRSIIVLLAVGFVPVLVFAWVFEFTPDGLMRESEIDRNRSITPQTGKKLDRIIMVVLALALGYFAFDKFALAPRREAAMQQENAEAVAQARREGGVDGLIRSYGDRSIAVLPFVNMSSDKEQDFFADGISEELLNVLAQVPQLRVIARTSSFSFKGKNLEIPEIGRQLKVAHVLEGSVRKAGTRVRITVQLIDAGTNAHLWSETYDRTLDDLLAVQDEIAAAVVSQLKLKMLPGSRTARKSDPKARALLIQARQLARLGTLEGHEQAYALTQQALKIDPGDPLAWDNVAFYYTSKVYLGVMPQAEAYRLAREATAKGLAADPASARPYSRLADLAINEGDLAAAATNLQRALELEPTSTFALSVASTLTAYLGRLDESIALSELLISSDPVNPITLVNGGESYLEAGRYAEAIEQFRTVLELTPGRRSAQSALIRALSLSGKAEEAMPMIKEVKDEDSRAHFLVMAYHAMGRHKESDAELARLVKKNGDKDPYSIAQMRADRGEIDQAFALLDRAVVVQKEIVAFALTDIEFANLRKDARWLPFLRKIGRAPEQLAAIKFKLTLPDPSAGLTL